jgi:hypothetical protein
MSGWQVLVAVSQFSLRQSVPKLPVAHVPPLAISAVQVPELLQ